MSSTRLLLAASSSTTSSARPSRIATQLTHVSSGSPSTAFRQLTAFATMRAVLVLPVPRGPTNSRPWLNRSSRTALRSVSMTASWATTSPNVWLRQRRYSAWWSGRFEAWTAETDGRTAGSEIVWATAGSLEPAVDEPCARRALALELDHSALLEVKVFLE